jgi:hypothetical protein
MPGHSAVITTLYVKKSSPRTADRPSGVSAVDRVAHLHEALLERRHQKNIAARWRLRLGPECGSTSRPS